MKKMPIKKMILEILSILLGIFGIAGIYTAFKFDISLYIKIVLVIIGIAFIGLALWLILLNDIKSGYYECEYCKEKFTPTWKDILSASIFHYFENAREIRCPKCNKKTTCHKKY